MYKKLPFDAYFIKYVPMEHLTQRHDLPTPNTEWFEKLVQDIDARGLQSPLLVETRPSGKRWDVKVGQTRLHALRRLGWTHAPCIIVRDPLPPGCVGVVKIESLVEGQKFLGDGLLANEKDHTLRVNTVMVPEHEKYPTGPVAYYNDFARNS